MKKIAILIEPKVNGEIIRKRIEIGEDEEGLDFFYKHIGCRSIEVISDEKGDVWVDEEGMYATDNAVVAVSLGEGSIKHNYKLSGKLLITKGADEEGETIFFNEDDSELIFFWENILLPVIGYVQ